MPEIISRPIVTVTNVIWSYDFTTEEVVVLLAKKADEPFKGYWSLPETFLRSTEDADSAALRLISDKIGVQLDSFHTEQLATFSSVVRTKSDRQLALAYMSFLPKMPELTPGVGAVNVAWVPVKALQNNFYLVHPEFSIKLPNTTPNDFYQNLTVKSNQSQLAFDHELIIQTAITRVRNKLDYAPSILRILGNHFTLKNARKIFANFLGISESAIDNSNFRKTHDHLFFETGAVTTVGKARPAKLYQLK